MRVTITGAAGMLGRDLAALLSSSQQQHELHLIDKPECEITDPEAVLACLAAAHPDAVIHAAAYTNVDDCELNPDAAMLVNGEGTRNVARAAAAVGARLLYISTDYVFDGRNDRPYTEDDPPNPLSAYGRSKLVGECAVREHPDSLVVRTSWLYGHHGRHFPGAILAQARSGRPLRVVNDQTGCPTWTCDLACGLAALLTGGRGIVHLAGGGSCSWYEFAQAVLEEAEKREGMMAPSVEPISTTELRRPAPRPRYSVLRSSRLAELGVPPLPHWRDALARFFSQGVGALQSPVG